MYCAGKYGETGEIKINKKGIVFNYIGIETKDLGHCVKAMYRKLGLFKLATCIFVQLYHLPIQ